MTEFDKIINNNFREFDNRMDRVCINRDELELICRMYAIEMCRFQRQICAENSYMSPPSGIGMISNTGSVRNCTINKNSILSATLPIELQ